MILTNMTYKRGDTIHMFARTHDIKNLNISSKKILFRKYLGFLRTELIMTQI